jgi:HSP20 family protein
MQRLFEDTFPDWEGEGLSIGAWNPRVDMFEKDDNLVVEAELPGVKKEDIDVRVENEEAKGKRIAVE